MQEPEDLFPYEALTPTQQEALRTALDADPALAETFARWQRLCTEVRGSLQRHLPDRNALVLLALEQKDAALLAPEEQAHLEAVRPHLARALRAHPALATVVRQIQRDCADFDHTWSTHFPPEADPVGRSRPSAPGAAASRPPRPHTVRRWSWRVGTALVLAAFVAIAVFVQQREQSFVTVQTGPDEVQVITLGNGSQVRLMGDSRLDYVAPEQTGRFGRRTRLVGRAFFDVEPAEAPFTVETASAVASVLGTQFSVEADDQLTEVVLATGRVAVAAREARERMVVLEEGQQTRVALGALPSTPAPVDLAEALGWTDRFFFRRTPLEEAARHLSAHYGVSIEVAPRLAGEQISGDFSKQDALDFVLKHLAATLGASLEGSVETGYRLAPVS